MPMNLNARKYITDLILGLNDKFKVSIKEGMFEYFVRVKYDNAVHDIELSEAIIDDFGIALSEYRGTPYFFTLESDIKFEIYTGLGKKGWLPKLCISDEIVNEKRDWLKNYRTNVVFDEKMTTVLSDGLHYLLNFLDSLLQNHEYLPLEDVKQHRDRVEEIYRYYKKNTDLNSDGAEIGSLQYLKAAAVGKIIELEHQKEKTAIRRISQAIDEEIYYIVEKLRGLPFLDIRLPDFVSTIKEASSVPGEGIQPHSFNHGKQVILDDDNLLGPKPEISERFDVAFSLAHEQHQYVDAVFKELNEIASYLNVFYYRDEGQEIRLWGRNMVEYLQAVYRDQSDHVIIFVSSDYLRKRWARHEWRSVQEAILDREEKYLLPARFDNTKLPGLHETIHYVDLSKKTAKTFAKMIVRKISSNNGKGRGS